MATVLEWAFTVQKGRRGNPTRESDDSSTMHAAQLVQSFIWCGKVGLEPDRCCAAGFEEKLGGIGTADRLLARR